MFILCFSSFFSITFVSTSTYFPPLVALSRCINLQRQMQKYQLHWLYLQGMNACYPYENTIDEPTWKRTHIVKSKHLIHMSMSYCWTHLHKFVYEFQFFFYVHFFVFIVQKDLNVHRSSTTITTRYYKKILIQRHICAAACTTNNEHEHQQMGP